jgi:hypothetical protein
MLTVAQDSGTTSATQTSNYRKGILKFRVGAYPSRPRVAVRRRSTHCPKSPNPGQSSNVNLNNDQQDQEDHQRVKGSRTPELTYEPFWVFPGDDSASTRAGVHFCELENSQSRVSG